MAGITINVGGKMDSASVKSAFGQVEAAARQSANRITESQANAYGNYWQRQATASPMQKKIQAANELIQDRSRTMLSAMGGGWAGDKESIKSERDALARALRARRALRDLSDAASVGGKKAGTSFWSGFMKAMQGSTSSSSQIASVVSNTLSSLGSGMSPAKIFMQQAPNFAQSITSAGPALLSLLASVGAIVGSIAAIIAAPFVYFSRVSGIVEKLSGMKLPELSTEYIARADKIADAYRKIATAIADSTKEYNSATSAARRMHDEINAQFKTQEQLDDIAKQRAISDAMGDKNRIAEIEKKYEQLAIQRESARLDAEKDNKINERKNIEAELKKTQEEIGKIGYGSEGRHKRNMDDMKAQFEEATKFLKENNAEKGFFGEAGGALGVLYRSGALARGLMGQPLGAAKSVLEQSKEEDAANQERIDKAQEIIRQYTKLVDLEESRNRAIEERNKLTAKGEAQGKRMAELDAEIGGFDKKKEDALKRMRLVAEAQAGLADTMAMAGTKSQQPLTSREQMGAYAGGTSAVTLLDVNKSQHKELINANKNLTLLLNAMKENY